MRIIDELNFMRLKSSTLWKLEILYLSLEHSLYHPCFQPPPHDVLVSRSLIEAMYRLGKFITRISPAEPSVGQQMVNTATAFYRPGNLGFIRSDQSTGFTGDPLDLITAP